MIELKVKTIEFYHRCNEDGETFFFDSHCHNTYELYMLISGNLDYTVGDKNITLKPFDLLIIPPHIFHCPHTKQGSYERIVFNFLDTDISKDVRPLLKKLGSHYYVRNHVFFRSIALEFSQSIYSLSTNVASQVVKNLIELSVTELSRQEQITDQARQYHPILSQIIEYIDNNIDKDLQQKSIAKQFYVTPSWINYSFKQHFNVCYSHYVKVKRMTYAQDLLQNGNQPKVVSIMCGFETYTTFLRQYKDFFKHPPISDYIAPQ